MQSFDTLPTDCTPYLVALLPYCLSLCFSERPEIRDSNFLLRYYLVPRTSYRLFNHSSCYPTRTRLFSGGKVVVARRCLHIFKAWYLSTGKTWRSAFGPVTSDNFIRPSSTFIPKTFAAVANNVPETVQWAFVEVQHVASFFAGAGVSGTGWRAYWVWWSGEGWVFMCLELKRDEVTCTDGAKSITIPGLENIFEGACQKCL